MGSGSSSYGDQDDHNYHVDRSDRSDRSDLKDHNDHNDHNDHHNNNDILELFNVAKNCDMSDPPDAVKYAIIKAVNPTVLAGLMDKVQKAENSGREFGSSPTDINTIMNALTPDVLPGLLAAVRKYCPEPQPMGSSQ